MLIPNTVKGGMKNLANLGVDIVNVHCAGGIAMMKAAIDGLNEGAKDGKRPMCIGVTQLTSTSKEAMNNELGIPGEVIDCVIKYAKNAKEEGYVPFGLINKNAVLKKDVKKGQLLTYEDVDVDTSTLIYELRKKQDEIFG